MTSALTGGSIAPTRPRESTNLATREQLEQYLELLLEHVDSSQYPSKQWLDRLDRLSTLL